MIAGQDFNKEMSSYMDNRRKEIQPFETASYKEKQTQLEVDEQPSRTPRKSKGFLAALGIVFRKRIPSDEEIHAHMKHLNEKEKEEAEEIQEEIEEIEEAEDELEMERESLFKKLFRKLGFYGRSDVVSDEEMMRMETEQVIVDDETKETLKLLHKWIEQLPPEKLAEFKSSSDFARYKELLRRMGLIKE